MRTTFAQRCMAQALSLGDDVTISHRSAAQLLGLDNFRPERLIHVTIPSDRRVARRADVHVHRASSLHPADRETRSGIPVTSPVRTIVDLSTCSTKRELENAVDSSLRMGLTTLDRLSARRDVLRAPNIGLLDDVLDGLREGGVHNRLERDYLALSRRAGLPDPRCQVEVVEGTIKVARVDFYYDGLFMVSKDSGHRTHSSRQRLAATAKRHRRIVAGGRRYIEFTSDEVFHEPDLVVAELRRFGAQ